MPADDGRPKALIVLHWLWWRTLVNAALLVGVDDAMPDRVERWSRRSFDLEHRWRSR